MYLFLQQAPVGSTPPRFVRVSLQPELFGGWLLLRESGEVGGRTTLRREHHPDQPSAIVALDAISASQRKRGFEPVDALPV